MLIKAAPCLKAKAISGWCHDDTILPRTFLRVKPLLRINPTLYPKSHNIYIHSVSSFAGPLEEPRAKRRVQEVAPPHAAAMTSGAKDLKSMRRLTGAPMVGKRPDARSDAPAPKLRGSGKVVVPVPSQELPESQIQFVCHRQSYVPPIAAFTRSGVELFKVNNCR